MVSRPPGPFRGRALGPQHTFAPVLLRDHFLHTPLGLLGKSRTLDLGGMTWP